MIKLIVAQAKNKIIGKGNVMPWHIKEELQFFRNETLGHAILMGRTTFEGIGKVLPGRTTYVLTSNKDYQVDNENVIIVNDIAELFDKYRDSEEVLFIAGGASIYKKYHNNAQELIITTLKEDYEGDSYLEIEYNNYIEIDKNDYEKFTITRYKRK